MSGSTAVLPHRDGPPPTRALTVVLTGAGGELGRRVAAALTELGDVEVVPLDTVRHPAARAADAAGPRTVDEARTVDEPHAVDEARTVDEPHAVDTADVVVDLGSSDYDRRAVQRESATEFVATTLTVADDLRADQVVFVSSAMVYGAFANNPVPITEEAPLRPDVEFVFARQLASAEELVDQWRMARPGRVATVLRPAVALAGGRQSRLAGALVAGLGQRFAEDDPPAQFLHLDDLVQAIVLAITERLDGVYNVAPDGWVAGARVRALSGERPRLPLPERTSEVLARLRWRFLRGPIPPGLRSYTRESWVISNGRLRAEGWTPTVTNEQAYVEATDARWWTVVSPKRRQELALAGGGALVVAVVALAVLIARHVRRQSSSIATSR